MVETIILLIIGLLGSIIFWLKAENQICKLNKKINNQKLKLKISNLGKESVFVKKFEISASYWVRIDPFSDCIRITADDQILKLSKEDFFKTSIEVEKEVIND